MPLWGPEARDPIDTCRPIDVEIYRPGTALLHGWQPPQRAAYRNLHGMQMPQWGQST